MQKFTFAIILSIVVTGTIAGAELERDLRAAWTFGEGGGSIAGDASPNRNDGTLVGARVVPKYRHREFCASPACVA